MSLIQDIRARFEASAHLPAILSADDSLPADSASVPAAVLVAIVDRPEPGLLLTRRNETLRNHAGQIAFAGGRADPEDRGPADTALREAWEEIALPPERVIVIGSDTPYRTGTGYAIVPVIGVVPPDLPLVPRELEVADIFEVPLAHMLDPANHVRTGQMVDGVMRPYHEIVWEDRHIWGATAALIVNLSRRIGNG